jgi:hypothetical protein
LIQILESDIFYIVDFNTISGVSCFIKKIKWKSKTIIKLVVKFKLKTWKIKQNIRSSNLALLKYWVFLKIIIIIKNF